ncbi:hypothetical protein KY343_06320 [Candidatus Woesearchaeota archaeon]|nr:hypothetical protein [Candidatus Woesearchaeota archaeon]
MSYKKVELAPNTALAKVVEEGKQVLSSKEVLEQKRQGQFLLYDIVTSDSVFYQSQGARGFVSLERNKEQNPLYKKARTATNYLKKGEFRAGLDDTSITRIITKGEGRIRVPLAGLELKSAAGEVYSFEFNPSDLSKLTQDQMRVINWMYGENKELEANMKNIRDNSAFPGRILFLGEEYVMEQAKKGTIMRALRINGYRPAKNPGFSACTKGIGKANFLVIPQEDDAPIKIEPGLTQIVYADPGKNK